MMIMEELVKSMNIPVPLCPPQNRHDLKGLEDEQPQPDAGD
jgi:hypothetical protein